MLYVTQPYTARAHDLVTVSLGVPLAVVASILATAWLCHRRSVFAALTATAAASATFIMCWFHLLTRTGPSQTAAEVAAAAMVPFLVLLAWIALRDTSTKPELPSWVPVVLVAAACLLLIAVVRLAVATAPVHQAHHLRLVWTGLDIFELVGLAATAWTLRRRSPRVPIAAAYTGTLLLCDAWFNVTATTGNTQISAVVLAFVEVPIAVGSLLLAYAEIRPAGALSSFDRHAGDDTSES